MTRTTTLLPSAKAAASPMLPKSMALRPNGAKGDSMYMRRGGARSAFWRLGEPQGTAPIMARTGASSDVAAAPAMMTAAPSGIFGALTTTAASGCIELLWLSDGLANVSVRSGDSVTLALRVTAADAVCHSVTDVVGRMAETESDAVAGADTVRLELSKEVADNVAVGVFEATDTVDLVRRKAETENDFVDAADLVAEPDGTPVAVLLPSMESDAIVRSEADAVSVGRIGHVSCGVPSEYGNTSVAFLTPNDDTKRSVRAVSHCRFHRLQYSRTDALVPLTSDVKPLKFDASAVSAAYPPPEGASMLMTDDDNAAPSMAERSTVMTAHAEGASVRLK